MSGIRPCVSVGMPVYNGERFMGEALQGLLEQTFEDIEIVISDNASTDRTQEVCREFAARDSRIRYYRVDRNRGSGWNHNHVFALSSGAYFKWHSHDDRCAPTFIQKCVEALDSDPSVVIAYPKTVIIDENGARLENTYKRKLKDGAPSASSRFRELMWYQHLCFPIYGLMRSDVLRRTPLLGCYTGGDNVLLARLALLGRFHEIPEELFFNRDHPARSTRALPARLSENRRRLVRAVGPCLPKEWWDTSACGKISYAYWNMLAEYFRSVAPAPIGWIEKAACYAYVACWTLRYSQRMGLDLLLAADHFLAPILRLGVRPGRTSHVEQNSGTL